MHERVLADCDQQYGDLIKARWKVIEGTRASISSPFYWVLVIWLAILFGTFGVTARPNAMVATVMILCALSITIAVLSSSIWTNRTARLLRCAQHRNAQRTRRYDPRWRLMARGFGLAPVFLSA